MSETNQPPTESINQLIGDIFEEVDKLPCADPQRSNPSFWWKWEAAKRLSDRLSTLESSKPAEPSPIQLKPGKWVMRNGEIECIVRPYASPNLWIGQSGRLYNVRGKHVYDAAPLPHDIISPFIEPSPPQDDGGIEERARNPMRALDPGTWFADAECARRRKVIADFARQESRCAAIEELSDLKDELVMQGMMAAANVVRERITRMKEQK